MIHIKILSILSNWTWIVLLLIGFTSCTFQEKELPNWSYSTSGRIQSDPIINNGIVYFGCNDGNFYALNANSGKEIWRKTTGFKIRSQAAVKKSTIVFSSGNNLYAVNKKTGEETWTYISSDTTGSGKMDPWDYHTGSPVINKSIVYTGFGNGLLLGFDVASGHENFRFRSIESSPIRSTPVVKNEVIYFGDWNGRVYAVDINSSDTIWTHKTYETQLYPTFGQIITRLVIYDTILLFGARNHEFQALSIIDGNRLWSFIDTNGGWISGDPLVQGDTLYVGASDSHKLFTFNVYTGDILWTYDFLFNNFSKPIISGESLLFTSGDAYAFSGDNLGDGYLYALDKMEGTLINMSHFDGNIFTSPVVQNGKLFISGDDMKIRTINQSTFLNSGNVFQDNGNGPVQNFILSTDSTSGNILINYEMKFPASLYVCVTNFDGELIKVLFDEDQSIGSYSLSWDGKNEENETASDGYYFVELKSGIFVKNRPAQFIRKQ